MIMKSFLFFLLVGVGIVACKQKATPNPEDPNLFGAALSDIEITDFKTVVDDLQTKEAVEPVKIRATVESVCQAKGCWMNLVSNDAPGAEMFVKFKDYGFFMPKDISGKEVILEGKAYVEETSVDELRHYAEDEGKSEEEIAQITEPVKEVKFMATGVRLLD